MGNRQPIANRNQHINTIHEPDNQVICRIKAIVINIYKHAINRFLTMKRRQLIEAIRQIANDWGYTLHVTTESEASAQIDSLPTILMAPPQLSHKSGRYHGRITYDVRLTMLHDAMRLSPSERQELHSDAETILLEMFVALSNNRTVANVESLTVKSSENSITPFGDTTTTASAVVVTIY